MKNQNGMLKALVHGLAGSLNSKNKAGNTPYHQLPKSTWHPRKKRRTKAKRVHLRKLQRIARRLNRAA